MKTSLASRLAALAAMCVFVAASSLAAPESNYEKARRKADKKLEKVQSRAQKNVEKVQKAAQKRLDFVRESANKRIVDILGQDWKPGRMEPTIERAVIDPEPPKPIERPKPKREDRQLPVQPVQPPVVNPKPEPEPLVPQDEELQRQEESEKERKLREDMEKRRRIEEQLQQQRRYEDSIRREEQARIQKEEQRRRFQAEQDSIARERAEQDRKLQQIKEREAQRERQAREERERQDSVPGVDVELYGIKYRMPRVPEMNIQDVAPASLAAQWQRISGAEQYSKLASDVHATCRRASLGGWAVLEFTDRVARAMSPRVQDQVFLQAWLMVQLGYDVRMANSGGKLHMIFRCDELPISNNKRPFSFASLDAQRYVFYHPLENGSFTVPAALGSNLAPVSLHLRTLPATQGSSKTRTLVPKGNPAASINVTTVNSGMLDFFDRYPRFSYSNGGVVSQWLNYAETPFHPVTESTLVQPLRKAVAGMSELDAVNYILSLVQTFPYGYDDQIWGADRPFFAEESLYYPKSDCEDHAILFTRLVKEILGLPCALIYYPGHLAAAVEFAKPVTGDYIVLDGHRMTVCDPTYYLPAGHTMPKMDNSKAQAVRF